MALLKNATGKRESPSRTIGKMMNRRTFIGMLLSTHVLRNLSRAKTRVDVVPGDGMKVLELIRPGEEAFVQVEGTRFVCRGRRFRFMGCNTYYLMYTARQHIDHILEHSARIGLNVIRTWAFGEGEGYLQTTPGVYREEILQNLDYVLAKADGLGLKLILPFVNNWQDYGGMDQYVKWSPTARDHNDFFTDSYCKTWFKHHIATILNRKNTINGRLYVRDATIAAWQLTNEARTPGDRSGAILQAWIDEMSTYLKSVDPRHLVTTGLEGFYRERDSSDWKRNGSQGTDFVSNHKGSAIDFCVYHLWPQHWQMDSQQESMARVKDHINQAHALLGKPTVLEEFGLKRDEDSPTRTRDKFYRAILNTVANGNAGGALFWAYYHDGYPDYDGYGVYARDTSTIAIIKEFAEKLTTTD